MSIQLADMLDRVDAASPRHRNIHDDDIRPLVFVALIGRCSVGGFTDDRYPFVLCKEGTVAFANDGVVVDNKDADHPAHGTSLAGTSNGIIAWSLKPLSPRSMISNCPPRAMTRSRMPTSPNPLPCAIMRPSAAPHRSFSIVSVSQRRSDAIRSPACARKSRSTRARAACACLLMLVRPSWTIR